MTFEIVVCLVVPGVSFETDGTKGYKKDVKFVVLNATPIFKQKLNDLVGSITTDFSVYFVFSADIC